MISTALQQRNELLGIPQPKRKRKKKDTPSVPVREVPPPSDSFGSSSTDSPIDPRKSTDSTPEMNEVQYLQKGGTEAAKGLLSLAKAIKGVVAGEETVGD